MGRPPTVEPLPSCSFLAAADAYEFCIRAVVYSETSMWFTFFFSHPNVIVESRRQELC